MCVPCDSCNHHAVSPQQLPGAIHFRNVHTSVSCTYASLDIICQPLPSRGLKIANREPDCVERMRRGDKRDEIGQQRAIPKRNGRVPTRHVYRPHRSLSVWWTFVWVGKRKATDTVPFPLEDRLYMICREQYEHIPKKRGCA
jgi:hypothetical protein